MSFDKKSSTPSSKKPHKILTVYKEKQIDHIMNHNMNPLISLQYNSNLKIIEAPLFYTSVNKIANNILYLRSNSFTGLEGHLSPDRTEDILQMSNSNEFLKFLSIFSGKLYRLRSNYLFKNLQQGYPLELKNSLIGYHYPLPFRKAQAIGNNKKLHHLLEIIGATLPNIEVKHHICHKWVKTSVTNNILGNILIGNKIIVKNLVLLFFFNSYDILMANLDILHQLDGLIPIYSAFYTIKYSIPRHSKIPLGKYLLGI